MILLIVCLSSESSHYKWRINERYSNLVMPNFLRSLSQAVTSFHVKSVIDPLIKLFLILLLFIIGAAWLNIYEWILICLVCFEGLVLFLILGAYICFAIYRPDYLRSETYNLKKQSLSILGDKENYKKVDLVHLVNITNPYVEDIDAIEMKGGEDE